MPEAMRIFRAASAPLMTAEEGEVHDLPDSARAGLGRMVEAGMTDGYVIKVLFSQPGFALHYAWFKPNYPLARHSHNTDCLYYIVGGSLKLGTEVLGPGDGFFLTADTPYIYTAGEKGLEILEFRHTASFTSRASGGTPAFWDKAVATITANRDVWLAAVPPRPAA